MIEVTNLVKKYGNTVAVDDLSFKVEEGQIYGFLGPNGAGKSTSMNIMTGYIAPTSGTVKINGFDILEEPEQAKKCIGYLPEIPPVYTDMKVIEYLNFAAELKGIAKSEIKENVEKVMGLTKVVEMQNRLIKNLSKGYRQRVGFAQALIGFPEVLIFDEPTVGLDPMQIIEMRELIKSLGKKHTVILSSHIMQEVSAVCDHIMIISNGKLIASDTPDNLHNYLGTTVSLLIEVKGDEEVVKEVLSDIPEVENFEIENTGDSLKIKIDTNGKEDIREDLSVELAQKRCVILSMQIDEASLEDVFIELTSKANEEALAAKEEKEAQRDYLAEFKEEQDTEDEEEEYEEGEFSEEGAKEEDYEEGEFSEEGAEEEEYEEGEFEEEDYVEGEFEKEEEKNEGNL